MSTIAYKPHVDGLRAIAVLAVVFYHAYVPGFGGGYVGVDVFFVISGYLITALLYKEAAETGDISLRDFVVRRIRRLAPAMFVVLLACLIASLVWLSPVGGEQQGLAKSAIATVFLVSNVYFWRNTGDYFDAPAETHPLLHMWSLSVEEQFYLLWPWLILLAVGSAIARKRKPEVAMVGMLGIVFAISLVACIAYTSAQPRLTFFLTPFRMWEFAIGGSIVFASAGLRGSERLGGALSAAGLAAVAVAIVCFDRGTIFPGWMALLPVLGAAGVILGCEASPRCLVAKLLSLKAMVGVGLISYSLYLWHWPILVYARAATLAPLPVGFALLLCALAAGLAWVTYTWVERPIRNAPYRATLPVRRWLAAGAAMMGTVVVAAGCVGIWSKFVWPQLGNNRPEAAAIEQAMWGYEVCSQSRPYSGRLLDRAPCARQQVNGSARSPSILLWGDSHAGHLVPAMLAASDSFDETVEIRTSPECLPLNAARIPTGTPRYREGCWHFNRDVVGRLATPAMSDLQLLVLAARWRSYARVPEVREELTRELRSTVRWAVARGLRVVIVAPAPEFAHPVPGCLSRRTGKGECGVPRSDSEKDRAPAMRMLREAVAGMSEVRIVDPFDALCGPVLCDARSPDAVLYLDTDHLSLKGSQSLAPLLAASVQWGMRRTAESSPGKNCDPDGAA